MNDEQPLAPLDLDRQLRSMEKDLRAYVDDQLDGIQPGTVRRRSTEASRSAERGAGVASIARRVPPWVVLALLAVLVLLVVGLGWRARSVGGQVEELTEQVESLSRQVEELSLAVEQRATADEPEQTGDETGDSDAAGGDRQGEPAGEGDTRRDGAEAEESSP